MNKYVLKSIKQWNELYYDLIKAEEMDNDELFTSVRQNMKSLESALCMTFDCEDRFPQSFMESLVKLVDYIENNDLEITDIKMFTQFKNMFNWDKEKSQLFNMLSAVAQKEYFIKEHYNAIYIEVNGFEFVAW